MIQGHSNSLTQPPDHVSIFGLSFCGVLFCQGVGCISPGLLLGDLSIVRVQMLSQ